MTNEEILAIAEQQSYAWLYIDRSTSILRGKEHWLDQLARLTPSQRRILETKMQRWQSYQERSRSRDNVVDMASRQTLQRENIANRASWALQQYRLKNGQRPA